MSTDNNIKLVKKLRDLTGASLKLCKEIIDQVGDDIELAQKEIKIRGADLALKKQDREAKEGLFCIKKSKSCDSFAVLRLNCETDFVAKNVKFQKLASDITEFALNNKITNVESLLNSNMNNELVSTLIANNISILGENVIIDSLSFHSSNSSFISHYIHNEYQDKSCGQIITTVSLENVKDFDSAKNEELFEQLAMHVAANSPASVDIESLDSKIIEKEKEIFLTQLKDSSKPKDIIEKIINGKMAKFYESSVFLEQKFVMNDSKKVKEILNSYNESNSSSVKISEFKIFSI